MFEMGFWELLVVLLIALLVLGPERLSQVAYWLGQWMGQLRATMNEAQDKPDEAPSTLEANEHRSEQHESSE